MDAISFLSRYFAWHYLFAWKDITRVYTNCAWAWWRLFSVPELVTHLFTPFERLGERPKSMMPGDVAGAALVTFLMSLVGACVRLPLITLGLLGECALVVLWVGTYVVWLAVPILSIALIVVGMTRII